MFSRLALVVPFFLFNAAYAIDCKLPTAQCARIERMVSKWKSQPLAAVTLAPTADAAPVSATGGEKSPEADAAASKDKNQTQEIGSCWYDEGENQIVVRQDAYAFSDSGFEECISGAFAQSRYGAVEGKWLTHLGAHEAWVIQNGVLTKVSVGKKKIETAAARTLWSSFATRELVAQCHAEEQVTEQNRAIASGGAKDADVRALLGME